MTIPETNMAMENPPFEDLFPIEHGDFPMLCLFSFTFHPLLLKTKSSL